MSTKNAVYLDAVLQAYVGEQDHGDFRVNLNMLQSRALLFTTLNAATKRELGELHAYWPGLETLAPNRILPGAGDDMSTVSSVGLNATITDRQVLPDNSSKLRGFRVAINAAKDAAIRCGLTRSDFEEKAATFLNTETEGYRRLMDEALDNYELGGEGADDAQSVVTGGMEMQAAAETSVAYWTSLLPVSFLASIREHVFVQL